MSEFEQRISKEGVGRELSIVEIAEMTRKTWKRVAVLLYPYKDQLDLPESVGKIHNIRIPPEIFNNLEIYSNNPKPKGWLPCSKIADKLKVGEPKVLTHLLWAKSPGKFCFSSSTKRHELYLDPSAPSEIYKLIKANPESCGKNFK